MRKSVLKLCHKFLKHPVYFYTYLFFSVCPSPYLVPCFAIYILTGYGMGSQNFSAMVALHPNGSLCDNAYLITFKL
jgi:hypothetical protein